MVLFASQKIITRKELFFTPDHPPMAQYIQFIMHEGKVIHYFANKMEGEQYSPGIPLFTNVLHSLLLLVPVDIIRPW